MADGSVTAAKMASGPGSIGQWTTAANSVDLYRPGGNVGVGTATPGSKLDVVGDIKASGNLTLSGTSSRVAINRTLSPGGATMIVRSAPGDTFLLYMEPGAGGLSFYVSRDGDVLAAGDISATGKLIANNKTAVVGEETLRIVRGIINLPTITTTASAGEKGTGYTVQKVTVAGLTPLGWRIRFDQPFSDTPSCTANIFGQFDWDNFISIVEATPDYVTLVSVDNGGTFFQDTDKISFIVVGPR